MLKCKVLIKLYVLRCVLICCVYGDTVRAEVLDFVSAGCAVWMFLWKLSWERSIRKMVRYIPEVHIEMGGSEEFWGLDVV